MTKTKISILLLVINLSFAYMIIGYFNSIENSITAILIIILINLIVILLMYHKRYDQYLSLNVEILQKIDDKMNKLDKLDKLDVLQSVYQAIYSIADEMKKLTIIDNSRQSSDNEHPYTQQQLDQFKDYIDSKEITD